MCFRPPEATAPQICSECGKKSAVIAGVRQETCPFCGAAFLKEDAPAIAAPAAPAAGASQPPVAPGAPKPTA